MPTISVPDDTYQRLAARAASLGTSVEALAVPALEQVVQSQQTPAQPSELPRDEWKANFDAWMAAVEARAGLYPPGFKCDVSRAAMYEGCGE